MRVLVPAHQSFEAAAEKIEKQLRRYKRRLKDRHEQAAHAIRQEEAAYVIFAAEEVEEEVPEKKKKKKKSKKEKKEDSE